MCHLDTFGLHRMLLAEVIIGDRLIVKVAYLSHIIKFIELKSSFAFISYTYHTYYMQGDNSLYPQEDDHHQVRIEGFRLWLGSLILLRRSLRFQLTRFIVSRARINMESSIIRNGTVISTM